MIVTCPNCTAKYRVRDDAVPAAGAQLRCPECSTLFLAHRPAHGDRELKEAIERVTRAKDESDALVRDLERRLKDQKAEAERQQQDLLRANEEAGRALASRDRELQELRAALEQARAAGAAPADSPDKTRLFEQKVAELATKLQAAQDEIERLRATPSSAGEVQHLSAALDSAQKVVGRLTTELDSAQVVIGNQLAELSRLREEAAASARGGAVPPQLLSLVSAVGPMLWGLDQAIRYLEPFSAGEPTLAAHVRHLQLLAGVLKRLAEAVSEPSQPRV